MRIGWNYILQNSSISRKLDQTYKLIAQEERAMKAGIYGSYFLALEDTKLYLIKKLRAPANNSMKTDRENSAPFRDRVPCKRS